MKYNLKNRPHGRDKREHEIFDKWFENFEKELREYLEIDMLAYAHLDVARELLKEILGE